MQMIILTINHSTIKLLLNHQTRYVIINVNEHSDNSKK